jgi:hypothetical protein
MAGLWHCDVCIPTRTFLLAHVVHQSTNPTGVSTVDQDLGHWFFQRHGRSGAFSNEVFFFVASFAPDVEK